MKAKTDPRHNSRKLALSSIFCWLFNDTETEACALLSKEHLDSEDYYAIHELIDNEQAKEYSSKDFKDEFIKDLKNDLKTLKEIQHMWKDINYDPKLEEFERRLSKDPILKKNKVIVFTESMETAEYLEKELSPSLKSRVRAFSSHSDEALRREIIPIG